MKDYRADLKALYDIQKQRPLSAYEMQQVAECYKNTGNIKKAQQAEQQAERLAKLQFAEGAKEPEIIPKEGFVYPEHYKGRQIVPHDPLTMTNFEGISLVVLNALAISLSLIVSCIAGAPSVLGLIVGQIIVGLIAWGSHLRGAAWQRVWTLGVWFGPIAQWIYAMITSTENRAFVRTKDERETGKLLILIPGVLMTLIVVLAIVVLLVVSASIGTMI